MESDPRVALEELYRAAIGAAAPGPALTAALDRLPSPPHAPTLIAIGKAAPGMLRAAHKWLAARGETPDSAIGIGLDTDDGEPAIPGSTMYRGDHPIPGEASLAAANALDQFLTRRGRAGETWLLLSGGASSLVAAPVDGIPPADFVHLQRVLFGSGLDISAVNRVRKRFSRFAAGRLAAALAPGPVRVFAMSDVPSNDLTSIGSGPCEPDASSAAELRPLLDGASLWDAFPESIRAYLLAVESGDRPETLKPGDPVFRGVSSIVVADNTLARDAVASCALGMGYRVQVSEAPLRAGASETGRTLGDFLLDAARVHRNRARCYIWGGETTVELGDEPGAGGRCQELALAVARRLDAEQVESRVTLLAAQTDGRDGPTDAAGAVVDGYTWGRIRSAGRNPADDLARHQSYPALDSAGALLRVGPTGTNVMDVVIGLIQIGRWGR